jgi:membrane protein implicated in regulation of membrane protease activity
LSPEEKYLQQKVILAAEILAAAPVALFLLWPVVLLSAVVENPPLLLLTLHLLHLFLQILVSVLLSVLLLRYLQIMDRESGRARVGFGNQSKIEVRRKIPQEVSETRITVIFGSLTFGSLMFGSLMWYFPR